MRVNTIIFTLILVVVIGSLVILAMVIMGKEPKFLQDKKFDPVKEHEKANEKEIERIKKQLEGG